MICKRMAEPYTEPGDKLRYAALADCRTPSLAVIIGDNLGPLCERCQHKRHLAALRFVVAGLEAVLQ